jgi:phosphopantothenoylcysteine decarboxylase/phosphopantothenate--cysteine ligase
MKKSGGPLAGREIVVGVTGGIAAYKSAEIVSKLVQLGAGVTVVMTEAATHFIAPLTFQALTRRRVLKDQFDLDAVIDAAHITLAEKSDLVVIAPATANTIGKIANGIGDDMLTSLMLAVQGPVLLAPAMNDRMWKNPVVQENLGKLKKRGYRVIGPEEGFLLEGRKAVGRLADPAKIVRKIEQLIK